MVAVDLRGAGGSALEKSGYDKETLAADVHQLVERLGVGDVSLVGEDFGGQVAYAYARLYRSQVRRLAVVEAGVPGFGLESLFSGSYHYRSHMAPELPERLIRGRERYYITRFFCGEELDCRKASIDEGLVDEYVRAYSRPGRLAAGLELYRALPRDAQANRARAEPRIAMPVLALGGEHGLGTEPLEQLSRVADDVTGGVVPGAGHWGWRTAAPGADGAARALPPLTAGPPAQLADLDVTSFDDTVVVVAAPDSITVDELARRAGTTTRNVRNYQTLGLLPPPTMAGRVGHYDEGHLARLRLIARLQSQGFSLNAIAALLQAWEEGRGLSEVLGFEQVLTAQWSEEVPEVVAGEELLELFPEVAEDPALAARAVELGLVVPEADAFRLPSPSLVRAGAELVDVGVPLAETQDEVAALRSDTARVAARFVALFERHVWEPFAAAGMPAERLPEVTDALRRLRPLAAIAVKATLAQAMEEAVAASTALQSTVEPADPGSRRRLQAIPEGAAR